MKHIAKSLKDSLKRAGLYQGVKSIKVLDVWPTVVGEKIARKTEAINIEKGILFIKVSNSTWRQELQLQSRKIVQKINKEMKENLIKGIKFK